jgi:hypothetical protein
MTTLLIKPNDITKNTILEGNIDKNLYLADVKDAQEAYIKPLLGKELYDAICARFIFWVQDPNSGLTGDYLTMYEDYILPMVIHSSAQLYLSHGAYKITNAGITKSKTEYSETVSKEEVDYLVQASNKLFQLYKSGFLTWIATKNITEYNASTKASSRVNVGGWSFKK